MQQSSNIGNFRIVFSWKKKYYLIIKFFFVQLAFYSVI